MGCSHSCLGGHSHEGRSITVPVLTHYPGQNTESTSIRHPATLPLANKGNQFWLIDVKILLKKNWAPQPTPEMLKNLVISRKTPLQGLPLMCLTPAKRALPQTLCSRQGQSHRNSVGSHSTSHSRPGDAKRRPGASKTLPRLL